MFKVLAYTCHLFDKIGINCIFNDIIYTIFSGISNRDYTDIAIC